MQIKLSLSTVTTHVRNAFPLILLMLFFGGAMRGYSAPYFNLYLTDNGFSGTLIGTLLSSAALVELLMIPLASRFADRTHTHRLFFRFLMLTYAFACVAILVVPVQWVLFVGVLVTQVNLRSGFLFGVQLAHTRFQQHGRDLLGVVRSMSAGGFMVANLTAGVLLLSGSYAVLFVAAAASGIMAICLSQALPQSTADKPNPHKGITPRNRQLYIFLASQFFVTMGIRNGFAFWLIHFQENLGISAAQIALIITLAAALEIPWFLYLDTAFKRFPATLIYTFGAVMFGIVWLLTGLVPGFLWVIVLMLPRGVAFATWNLSALFHVNAISRPENVATNQALGQITVPGIAALISGAPMGYVWDTYSPPVFFSICCAFLLIGAAVMVVSGRREAQLAAS
jgi:MFS family permease